MLCLPPFIPLLLPSRVPGFTSLLFLALMLLERRPCLYWYLRLTQLCPSATADGLWRLLWLGSDGVGVDVGAEAEWVGVSVD